jgi:tetratricopeptide (TPR) repeat protein
MTTRLSNPYVVGTPLSGGHGFYGREDVLQFVLDTLEVPTQNVVVLFGQRRIGKTSLLHQIIARGSEQFHGVIFDLQGKGRLELPAILAELTLAVARSLKWTAPSAASFASDPAYFQDIFLPRVLDKLGPKRLLLLLDEFDVLSDEPSSPDNKASDDLLAYLKDLIGREPRLAYVFVIGRRVDEMPLHYRSLFKQAVFRRLSVMQRGEAMQLISRPAAGVLDYTSEAIDTIFSLTSGHPYLTQLLCHVIFKRLAGLDMRTVGPNDVSACIDEAMELGTGGLDWFWESLPRAERIVLSALADALQPNGLFKGLNGHGGNGNGLSNKQYVVAEDQLLEALERHRVRLLDGELTNARQRLVEWEIITEEHHGYRFRIDLVRRWITREHPLERAQQDIDLVGQRAERYFSNARDAHLAGDLPLAIEDYQRALAVSPNHFGARLGLAQALQASNDLPAAILEFEKAYRLDPSAARDELLSARLALGIAHQHKGNLKAAIEELERVMAIVPDDEEARQRLISICLQCGERELVDGNYGDAIAYFDRTLGLGPDDPSLRKRIKQVIYGYSKECEARDRWDAALESLSRLAGYLPEDDEVQGWVDETRSKWRANNYYEVALRAQTVGDHRTAVEESRRALEANPNHAQARLLLASQLHQIDDLSNAIEEYEQAYRLDPESASAGLAQARLQRAALHEAEEDIDAAVIDYERALAVQPNATVARDRLPQIWMAWAEDHLAAERMDETITLFQKSLQATRQFPQLAESIKSKLAAYSRKQRAAGNWDTAMRAIERLRDDLGLRGADTAAWYIDIASQRGEEALEQKRYDDAAAAFTQALKVAAEHDQAGPTAARIKTAFFAHADAYLDALKSDQAVATLERLLKIVGEDEAVDLRLAKAWCLSGDIALKNEQLAEAEQAYQRAIEVQPNNFDAMARLAGVSEQRRLRQIEILRKQAAEHVARKNWTEAQTVYKQLLFDLFDEESRKRLSMVSEEIRLEELFTLAQSLHEQRDWNAAITVWLEICHLRNQYLSRDGRNASEHLIEALEQRDGVVPYRRKQLEQIKFRLRLAWIIATLFGLTALGELLFILTHTTP